MAWLLVLVLASWIAHIEFRSWLFILVRAAGGEVGWADFIVVGFGFDVEAGY